MSDHKKRQTKKAFKKAGRPVRDDSNMPVEVVVYDCVMHERCVVEYRNESSGGLAPGCIRCITPASRRHRRQLVSVTVG